MNKTRWLYNTSGGPAYYQDGDYVYSTDGKTAFWVSNGWWYAVKGGAGTYYVNDNWVYSTEGRPAFYYG